MYWLSDYDTEALIYMRLRGMTMERMSFRRELMQMNVNGLLTKFGDTFHHPPSKWLRTSTSRTVRGRGLSNWLSYRWYPRLDIAGSSKHARIWSTWVVIASPCNTRITVSDQWGIAREKQSNATDDEEVNEELLQLWRSGSSHHLSRNCPTKEPAARSLSTMDTFRRRDGKGIVKVPQSSRKKT